MAILKWEREDLFENDHELYQLDMQRSVERMFQLKGIKENGYMLKISSMRK